MRSGNDLTSFKPAPWVPGSAAAARTGGRSHRRSDLVLPSGGTSLPPVATNRARLGSPRTELLSCFPAKRVFFLSREGQPAGEATQHFRQDFQNRQIVVLLLRSAANERASLLRREARSRRPSVPAPWRRGPLEPEGGWSKPPSAHPRDRGRGRLLLDAPAGALTPFSNEVRAEPDLVQLF